MNTLEVALTSAVVSAVVSGCTTLFAQHLERRSREQEAEASRKIRERELLLNKSIEMAFENRRTLVEEARTSGRELIMIPDIANAAETFKYLEHLFHHGDIPPELKEDLKLQEEDIKRGKH